MSTGASKSSEERKFLPPRGGLLTKICIGGVLRVSAAYPTIRIRPNTSLLGTDNDAIKSVAPDRTATIDIDGGDSAPPNIELFCQDLFLVGGDKIDWQGKNVKIHCRKIIFLRPEGHPDDDHANHVEFNLAGKAGTDAGPAKAVSDPGKELDARAPGIKMNNQYDSQGHFQFEGRGSPSMVWPHGYTLVGYEETKGFPQAAQAGRDAPQAKPDQNSRGGNAGSFSLWCDMIESQSLQSSKAIIYVDASGGNGGNGQAGVDGTKGGNGLDRDGFLDDVRFDNEPRLSYFADSFRGAPGGHGSLGTPGGRGGHGGNLTVTYGGKEDVAGKLVAGAVDAGREGTAGSNGKAGGHGNHSTSMLYKASDLWARVMRQVPGGDHQIDRGRVCEEIFKFAESGKGPESINTVNPDSLTGDLLWASFTDSAQEKGVDGKVTPSSDALATVRSQAALDPVFLRHMLDRLRFEHFINFTSQAFAELVDEDGIPGLSNAKQIKQNQFKEIFDWMTALMDAGSSQKNLRELASWELVYEDFRVFVSQVIATPAADIFQHSSRFVPQAPSADAVKDIIESLKNIQGYNDDVQSNLSSNQAGRDTLKAKIDNAKTALEKAAKSISDANTDIDTLNKRYDSASNALGDQLDNLREDLKGLETAIKIKVDCEVTDIVEALGNALMFTDGSKKAAIGGAALSVGTSAIKAYQKSTEQINGVDKKLLYSRLHYMTKTFGDLKQEIGDTQKDIKKDNDQDVDKELYQAIIADKEDFEAMYRQYLDDIGAAEPVRLRFKQVIKAMDAKSRIIEAYNVAVAQIAQAKVETGTQARNIEQFKTSTAGLSDDDLQVVSTFTSRAYENISKFAFWTIYSRARAFNCGALAYTPMFSYLDDLYTFNNIRAEDVQTLSSYLDLDCSTLTKNFQSATREQLTSFVVWNAKSHSQIFERLKSRGSFTIDADAEVFSEWLSDANAYDVRLYDIKVFFDKAKRKAKDQPKSNQPSSHNEARENWLGEDDLLTKDKPTSKSTEGGWKPNILDGTSRVPDADELIFIQIQSNGSALYRDQDLVEYRFDFPPLTTGSAYTTDPNNNNNNNYYFHPHPMSNDDIMFDFATGSQSSTPLPMPLRSPMSVWKIIPDVSVDLQDVTAVAIQFSFSYRESDASAREARLRKKEAAKKERQEKKKGGGGGGGGGGESGIVGM